MKQKYEIQVPCRGRDRAQKGVLDAPVEATIAVTNSGAFVSLDVTCEYVGGGHSHKCKATGEFVGTCPYAIDLPYALDNVDR